MKRFIEEHSMEVLLAVLIMVFVSAALITSLMVKYSDTAEEVQFLDKAFEGFFGLATSGMGGLIMKITAGAKGPSPQTPNDPKP